MAQYVTAATPYHQISYFYELYVLGRKNELPWPASNEVVSSWLDLALIKQQLRYGNGYAGPYWRGMDNPPPKRITVVATFAGARASVDFLSDRPEPVNQHGFDQRELRAAKTMIESKFNIKLV